MWPTESNGVENTEKRSWSLVEHADMTVENVLAVVSQAGLDVLDLVVACFRVQ